MDHASRQGKGGRDSCAMTEGKGQLQPSGLGQAYLKVVVAWGPGVSTGKSPPGLPIRKIEEGTACVTKSAITRRSGTPFGGLAVPQDPNRRDRVEAWRRMFPVFWLAPFSSSKERRTRPAFIPSSVGGGIRLDVLGVKVALSANPFFLSSFLISFFFFFGGESFPIRFFLSCPLSGEGSGLGDFPGFFL